MFHVVLDALRGELFASKWQRDPGGGLREIRPLKSSRRIVGWHRWPRATWSLGRVWNRS